MRVYSTMRACIKHPPLIYLSPQKTKDIAKRVSRGERILHPRYAPSGPHGGPPCGTCSLGQRWMSKLNARVLIGRACVSRSRKLPVRLRYAAVESPPSSSRIGRKRPTGSVIFSPPGTCPRVYARARYGKVHVKCGSYTRVNVDRPRENW